MPKRSMTRFLNLWEQIDCLLLVFPSSHLLAKMAKIKVLMQPFQFSMFQKNNQTKNTRWSSLCLKFQGLQIFAWNTSKSMMSPSFPSLPSLPLWTSKKTTKKHRLIFKLLKQNDVQMMSKWCWCPLDGPIGRFSVSLLVDDLCEFGHQATQCRILDVPSLEELLLTPGTASVRFSTTNQRSLENRSLYLERRCAIRCNPISQYLRSDKYNSKI